MTGCTVNGTYLRELMTYWQNGFDWRAQEARINSFPQFCTKIDGAPVHFIHVRGKGPAPVPIILNHGWLWSFWDFKDIIMALADPAAHGGDPEDAFEVVVPLLPGFAFSGPLPRNCVGYVETASIWVELMRGLGYERCVTHGGDAQLGHAHPEWIIGVQISFPVLPGEPYVPTIKATLLRKNALSLGARTEVRGLHSCLDQCLRSADPRRSDSRQPRRSGGVDTSSPPRLE